MITIYFVRHGETTFNAAHLAQGWSNPPLTALGRTQASLAGQTLADIHFDAVYSADLDRHRSTAQLILEKNHCAPPVPQIDWRLREANYGSFEGKPEKEMMAPVFAREGLPYGRFDLLFERVSPADLMDCTAAIDPLGNAESSLEVHQRFKEAIDSMIDAAADGQNILAVTSGGVLGMLLRSLDEKRTEAVANGSIAVLSYGENGLSLSHSFKAIEET